jgi:RNA polymerase sigma factor (sigma-70 family)
MPTSPMSEVIQHLRSALLRERPDQTDGQLLVSFLSRQDMAALEALVLRHGPMVWGLCRRVLRHYQDAEDAFQATFLVLVRKAASIASREKVGNWLYGVAHQTALKARATRAKRQVREEQVLEMPEPVVTGQDLWGDLLPLLDQEVSQLPEKYRTVLVLCELEGKTRNEAGRQLGLPEGTVASRVARAKTMLARRLARHGLAITGVALAAVLSQKAVAAVPTAVMGSTIEVVIRAAGNTATAGLISAPVAGLTEGVLKAMLLTRLKVSLTALLVLGMICVGGVLCTHQMAGAEQGAAGRSEPLAQQVLPPPGPDALAPGQPAKSRVYQIGDDELPGMLRDPGMRFDLEVIGRIEGPVSGTNLYFWDSSLEAAAVHAGLVQPGEKTIVTVTVVRCPVREEGSIRNGVKSSGWEAARKTDTAFLLQKLPKGDKKAAEQELDAKIKALEEKLRVAREEFRFLQRDAARATGNPADLPTAEALLASLNDNARKVQGLQAFAVDIDCRAGMQAVGLSGKLAFQKPRAFRLKADLAGTPCVDIGSNNEEFWCWIKQGEEPFAFHCKHSEWGQAVRALPFPIHPELLFAALGVAEFDPSKTYERKVNPDTIELIEHVKSPQGRDQIKVVVFNRTPAAKGKPQVVAYHLKDAETSKIICQAIVLDTQAGPSTGGAIVPYRVELTWPEQKVRLKLTLGGLQVRNFNPQESARLFDRPDLQHPGMPRR